MKILILVECIIVAFLINGCSYIPFIEKSPQLPETVTQSAAPEKQLLESNNFVEKGRIISKQALEKGKNIAIVPFTAGVNVEASSELDKVALMIVKGVSDAFADDHSGKHDHFSVLTAEDSQAADLFVQGHIRSMKNPSRVKSCVLLKGQRALSVDGKIVDATTGESVMIFEDVQATNVKDEGHDQLGYRIGKNIGRFILSGVE